MVGHVGHVCGVLVMTFALALWPTASRGRPASAGFETAVTAFASISPPKNFAVMVGCRGGAATAQGVFMSAAVCSAHCGLAAAIVPIAIDFPTTASYCVGLCVTAEAEDYVLPPDPPPPRTRNID